MLKKLGGILGGLGHRVIEGLWRVGAAGRLFFYVWIYLFESLKRPRLIIREVYATGVLSLLIILVSAFFVGMVLGLQGYNTLQKIWLIRSNRGVGGFGFGA